jgi:hypothetical protein
MHLSEPPFVTDDRPVAAKWGTAEGEPPRPGDWRPQIFIVPFSLLFQTFIIE